MGTRRLAGWSALLVACSGEPQQTEGPNGHVWSAFEGRPVSVGTDVKPMMAGSQEPISVLPVTSYHPGGLPPLSVVSSAPDVVSVDNVICCEGGCNLLGTSFECPEAAAALLIMVTAVAPGAATLGLFTSDATLFDEVNLTVAEPASLTTMCAPVPGIITAGSHSPIPSSMKQGTACALFWTATDGNGVDLMASAGVTFTSSNPNVVAFTSLATFGGPPTPGPLEASQSFDIGNSVIVATGIGQSTLVASARSITQSDVVQVTP